MNKLLALLGLMAATANPALAHDTPASVVMGTTPFTERVIISGLEGPWEVTMGPDGWLWVTERTGGRITRVNPADGTKQVAYSFKDVSAPGGQDGLLGMALDPGLLQDKGQDHVYASYTYVDKTLGGIPWVKDRFSPYHDLWVKIVRLTYDKATGTLSEPVDVITAMPAKNDHNSGRLKHGPDGKLYYTIGDGGKNQLGNWCIPIEAQRLPTADEVGRQDWIAYQGKTLRLNTDGSIPEDNPVLGGVRSHVFTYGHRNSQGIAFAADGTLYASEQGPKTDDEVNVLVPGGNYGWPHVSGFRDDKAYEYARWVEASTPCDQLTFTDLVIDPSVPRENETAWQEPTVEPLATLFTVPSDWNFSDPACGGIDFICWPTVAASSIEVYQPQANSVPGFAHSLLVTTLKRGSLYVLPLDETGRKLEGHITRYFKSENRFRDLALSPDGQTIYIATDPGGLTESKTGGTIDRMENPGAILAFTHDPVAAAEAGPEAADPIATVASAAEPVEGMPVSFTADQVERGKVAYAAGCITCHGAALNGAYGPPVAGSVFDSHWRGKTVGALWRHTHDRMPPSRPATLSDETYTDLVAYMLSVNGIAVGTEALPVSPSAQDLQIIPAKSP
jgi:PQQ-dependent dehydrogenase (s-GDH family)